MKPIAKPIAPIRGAAFLLLSVIMATGMACAQASHSSSVERSDEPQRIPFTVDQTGLPTFKATIGGRSVTLFLDFGGYKALALKQHVLKNLPVTYKDKTQHFTSSGGTSSTVKTLTARDFKTGTVQLSTIDGSSLPDDLYSFPQDGYLGFGYLKGFFIVFDYAHGEARLYSPKNPKAMRDECGTHVLPVTLTTGVAEVTAETELGHRIFSLDTGANQDVVRPGKNPVLGAPGTFFNYRKLRLGALNLDNQRFLVVPYAAPNVDGVLGRGFFSEHLVCIDMAAGKVGVK